MIFTRPQFPSPPMLLAEGPEEELLGIADTESYEGLAKSSLNTLFWTLPNMRSD